MEQIVVKKVENDQINTVAQLAKEIWTEHYINLISKEQIDYMLEKFQSEQSLKRQIAFDGYDYYVAYYGNVPAGYCGVRWKYDSKVLFLSKLYVKSEFRKKGISKALLQASYDEHPKYEKVYLTVNKNNEDSINAYKALGFKISDSVVQNIGEGFLMDDYKMTLIR